MKDTFFNNYKYKHDTNFLQNNACLYTKNNVNRMRENHDE